MNDQQQSKALDEIHDHAVTLMGLVDSPQAREVINEIVAVARYKFPMGRKFSSGDSGAVDE